MGRHSLLAGRSSHRRSLPGEPSPDQDPGGSASRAGGGGHPGCGKWPFGHFLVGTKETKNHLPLSRSFHDPRFYFQQHPHTQHNLTEELARGPRGAAPAGRAGPQLRSHSSSCSSRAPRCTPASLDAPRTTRRAPPDMGRPKARLQNSALWWGGTRRWKKPMLANPNLSPWRPETAGAVQVAVHHRRELRAPWLPHPRGQGAAGRARLLLEPRVGEAVPGASQCREERRVWGPS